jgi:hypothetical protein
LLLFGAEFFVFQLAFQMQRQNYNSALFFSECENWSLTLREDNKPRVFENKVLRRIFGPKRDEVTGELRRQHEEEHYDLYSSPNGGARWRSG